MGFGHFDETKEYFIAELKGSKIKTFNGFINELKECFSISQDVENINDVNFYIFTDKSIGKKIKFIILHYDKINQKEKEYILEILESWKEFHQKNDGYKIEIELN